MEPRAELIRAMQALADLTREELHYIQMWEMRKLLANAKATATDHNGHEERTNGRP